MLKVINQELQKRRQQAWVDLYSKHALREAHDMFLKEFNSSPTPKEYQATKLIMKLQHVYFITDGKYVKIGMSNNVKGRLDNLQSANPHKLSIALVVPYGGRELELELHAKFAEHRVRGEWFKIAPPITKYINKIANVNLQVYGQPLSQLVTKAVDHEQPQEV